MYIPKAFEVTDRATLHDFIEANSFATLVTSIDDAPFATRLPMLLERETGAYGTLIGHVARANPHWRSFDGKALAVAMFDGPHAYISPNWYVTAPAVPTWNYATVHAYGAPRVIEDPHRVEAIVDRLVAIHEASIRGPGLLAYCRLNSNRICLGRLSDSRCRSIASRANSNSARIDRSRIKSRRSSSWKRLPEVDLSRYSRAGLNTCPIRAPCAGSNPRFI